MDDDVNITDGPCPHCGNATLHTARCREFDCEDGWRDAYEDDPISNSPGELEKCWECRGTGIIRWCPKCGADVVLAAEGECD